MQVTINLYATCPVCGCRNQGVQVGNARPGMTGMRLKHGSIGFLPPACDECGHPLGHDLFDRGALDAESAAKLKAWRDRQRARRASRKGAA